MMMFQFGKTKRTKKVDAPNVFKYKQDGNVDPEPFPIQGIMPQSKQEFRAAMALQRLKIPFTFQYQVFGGRSLRGGQVIDFMVWTKPLPTPIYIQGSYWHRGATKAMDDLKQEAVKHLFDGQINPPLPLPEEQLSSIDAAYDVMRRELL